MHSATDSQSITPENIYLQTPPGIPREERLRIEDQIRYTADIYLEKLKSQNLSIIHRNELEGFAHLYIRHIGDPSLLSKHMASKFSHAKLSNDKIKRLNDQAIVLADYIDFLSYPTPPENAASVSRFDQTAIEMHQTLKPSRIAKNAVALTLKNLLNYALILLDMTIVTQNPLSNHFPEKSLIHGLALTSLFFIFVGEVKFEFFPSAESLLNAAKDQPKGTYGQNQYKVLLETLGKEISGECSPEFFSSQQLFRLKAVEEILQIIPGIYLFGIIGAPVTIPATLILPMLPVDDWHEEPTSADVMQCFGLALHIVVFGMMMFSDDITHFLRKFIYCDNHVCFVDEARATTAALGGGTSALLSFLLLGLYQMLKPKAQAVGERMHHSYLNMRAEPFATQPITMPCPDVELENYSTASASSIN